MMPLNMLGVMVREFTESLLEIKKLFDLLEKKPRFVFNK